MACAFLALRSVTAGDSAGGARVLLVAFVAASAAINYRHAEAAYGDPAAALFFGGMSVAAVAMWDLVLRQLRRATLRQIGALERPLPRFRLLRWIPGIAFRETWAAWRVSIRRGLSRPEDALAIVWAQPAPVLTITGSLDGLSKADAVRAAFAELGAADVPAALTWLAERGVEVDRSYAYDVARRQAVPPAHPELGQAAA